MNETIEGMATQNDGFSLTQSDTPSEGFLLSQVGDASSKTSHRVRAASSLAIFYRLTVPPRKFDSNSLGSLHRLRFWFSVLTNTIA